MLCDETFNILVRTIEDHIDVGVASGPRILEELAGAALVTGRYFIAEPVQRLTKGFTPLLIPISVTASVTTTIALPALDAMDAAPRTVLENLDLVRGRIGREKLSVICDARQLVRLNLVHGIGKCHFSAVMMMAVTFAVGGDVH